MLNASRAVVLLLLLVPFVVGGCITVENDLLATPTPTPAAQTTAQGSPTPAPVITPTPLPTPAPTPEPVEAEVLTFVPYWLLEDAAEDLDPSLVTIAAFHSVEASQDGRLVSKKANGDVPGGWTALRSDAFADLKKELQREGVKVVPVVQRTAWTDGARQRSINLLTKKKNRTALVKRIVEFIGARGFDGVNLDFEPIPARAADAYVTFVRELRAAFDEVDPELHLSLDVVPGLENYDLAALTADDAADLAVIMGYGFTTRNSAVAGSTAPLSGGAIGDLSTSVTAALEQTGDGERLMLALPWYGYSWATQSDAPGSRVRSGEDVGSPATADYAGAVEGAAKGGRRYDEEQASAWTTYAAKDCTRCPATWRQIWYDDPDSFATKIGFAIEQDLAGIGVWAPGMDGEHEEMWWSLRNQLHPLVDDTPPAGSPAFDPETVQQGDIDGLDVIRGSASLRLFAADEPDGSGLGFVRIGLVGELDDDGALVTGRTYPAVDRIEFPLGDQETGGSAEEGPRSIHVQWRDLAGNWSTPVVLEAHVIKPLTTATPADL